MTDIAEPSIDVPVDVRGITRAKAPEPDLTGATITGDRYWSAEFAQREAEAMWPRVWQVAGRVDQIPAAGDYVTYEIGRDSVIAVRGSDQQVRVFYNVCQHRGNRLVTAESGSLITGEFECAYHGWRFGDDGNLNWVPDEDDFTQGSPCGKRNLVEMLSDTWAGFIWFNMDPEAKPLRDWLAPVADHLDAYQMENMRRTHWVTVVGEFNWKCVQDNFNESYHLPYVHPQTLASMNEHHSGCQFDLYPSGHARMLMPGGGPGPQYSGKPERTLKSLAADLSFWGVDGEQYRDDLPELRSAIQQAKRRLGSEKGYDFSRYSDEQLTDNYHYTVFPNISFSMKPDGCIWLRATPHPTDPQKCFFDMWYLTLFPEGSKEYFSNSMKDWVSIDHQVEHQTGLAGEVSCGPGIDQDVAIWNTQQQGLRSRGYRGEYSPTQERRIQFFHDNLERYLALGPLDV
jgi:phenylpropionate dioxygenase-like ring-hydroxylating dioxygenase large terminal subunit|tara:strand:- start:8620 stop:9987 length:1368 start_codon:yes stop_codon:yes gene_type:complete